MVLTRIVKETCGVCVSVGETPKPKRYSEDGKGGMWEQSTQLKSKIPLVYIWPSNQHTAASSTHLHLRPLNLHPQQPLYQDQ